jgi:hypothetical protein
METWKSIGEIFYADNLMSITLKDSITGEPVHGVEWVSADYEGKLLVNICNYDWSGKKSAAVFVGERLIESAAELISGSTVNAGNLELMPYTPILLSIEL